MCGAGGLARLSVLAAHAPLANVAPAPAAVFIRAAPVEAVAGKGPRIHAAIWQQHHAWAAEVRQYFSLLC